MAGENYRIHNRAKFSVGFYKVSGVPAAIVPGRFLLLSEDDLIYNAHAMGEWLRKGTLEADDPHVYELFGLNPGDERIMTMDESAIRGKLKANLRGFTEWLDGIESMEELSRIQQVAACDEGLTSKKAELIEHKTGRTMADVKARMGEG